MCKICKISTKNASLYLFRSRNIIIRAKATGNFNISGKILLLLFLWCACRIDVAFVPGNAVFQLRNPHFMSTEILR